MVSTYSLSKRLKTELTTLLREGGVAEDTAKHVVDDLEIYVGRAVDSDEKPPPLRARRKQVQDIRDCAERLLQQLQTCVDRYLLTIGYEWPDVLPDLTPEITPVEASGGRVLEVSSGPKPEVSVDDLKRHLRRFSDVADGLVKDLPPSARGPKGDVGRRRLVRA